MRACGLFQRVSVPRVVQGCVAKLIQDLTVKFSYEATFQDPGFGNR